MSIKTNELQKITSLRGTDTILVDTDEKGTGRAPFDTATEFFKETFLSGGVPYGKELTESWPELQTRELHRDPYRRLQTDHPDYRRGGDHGSGRN